MGLSHRVPEMASSRRAETAQMTRPKPQTEPKASTRAAAGRLLTEKPPAR